MTLKSANRKLYSGVVLICLVLAMIACSIETSRPSDLPLRQTIPVSQPAVEKQITSQPASSPITPSPAVIQPTEISTMTATPVAMALERKKIPAPSLKNNLLDTSDEQNILILLPPSYYQSNQRYPVVYFLPGFGGSPDDIGSFDAADEAGTVMASGQVKEMIIVVPNGANILEGSFYVNSPVTGNWEDYILNDVIGYVDANYRTIPKSASRGIAGHSMGGYAAFHLAMRHPDVFGAAYLVSPGLLGEKGLADFHVLSPEKRVKNFIKIMQNIQSMNTPDALREMEKLDGPNALAAAYGTAFAPDPQAGPPYFDYPYKLEGDQLVKDPKVWALWENGMGNLDQKIQDYHDNLAQLKGIAIDYARQDRLDWIIRGSEYLAKLLTKAGIPNQLTSYDGNHGDFIPQRIAEIMLPFFSQTLEGPK